MLEIQSPSQKPSSPHPILNLAFRIFFSSAAVFAVVIMALWVFIYMGKTGIDTHSVNPFYWHAHEMLYGYTLAVIAGFLLTAVKTWTGVMMPYGYRLLGIFMCWALARVGWILVGLGVGDSNTWLMLATIFDLAFIVWTAGVIIKAVLAVKQYRQMGIISKLILLTIGNGLVYWGIFTNDMTLMRVGVYLGLYLIIGVVLTISRRVVPFFTQGGVNRLNAKQDRETNQEPPKFVAKNNKILDIISLVAFIVFMLADLFYSNKYLILISAMTVALANLIRLIGWYHPKIWKLPLLWSLHLALYGCCISFMLFAIQPWAGFSHSLAVHALAISGVGMMTVAMMARVSLGHTGRSIHTPPKTVTFIVLFMVLVFVFRVVMPLLFISEYTLWLMIAQTCWIASFTLFCVSYLPILSAPRTDKLFG